MIIYASGIVDITKCVNGVMIKKVTEKNVLLSVVLCLINETNDHKMCVCLSFYGYCLIVCRENMLCFLHCFSEHA